MIIVQKVTLVAFALHDGMCAELRCPVLCEVWLYSWCGLHRIPEKRRFERGPRKRENKVIVIFYL